MKSAVLSVDGSRCTGHGRCYTAAPDLLPVDDEGFVAIRGGRLVIPPDRMPEAERAVRACPERAVALNRRGGATDVRSAEGS